ncbi:MAG: hypothetical protein OES21_00025 [Myxococcales bacterium]|nr:hypothetical protein [Myxococcales bacterium]
MTDRGEVAADGGHVCERGVAEVVGAQVLGFVLGAEHFACGLNEDAAVLEVAEDDALLGADRIEHAARSGGQRDGPGVSRLVDLL